MIGMRLFFSLWDGAVHRADLWRELLFKSLVISHPSNNFMMGRETGKSPPKPTTTPPSHNRAPAEAGLLTALKEEERFASANLIDTRPGEPLLYINVFMGNSEADALSTASMEVNVGDYSELPDCMIIDPQETLPEEIFDF